MNQKKLLEQINNIHTSEILGGNQECKICGENKVDLDFLKSKKYIKSKKSKSYKFSNINKIIIIVLLLVISIMFANNILITNYLNINSKEIVNSLTNKFSNIKDYFINKNV